MGVHEEMQMRNFRTWSLKLNLTLMSNWLCRWSIDHQSKQTLLDFIRLWQTLLDIGRLWQTLAGLFQSLPKSFGVQLEFLNIINRGLSCNFTRLKIGIKRFSSKVWQLEVIFLKINWAREILMRCNLRLTIKNASFVLQTIQLMVLPNAVFWV